MTSRARAVVAVSALVFLLGGVMVYSVFTDELTGTVYSTESESDSQSPPIAAPGGGTYSFMATQPGTDDVPVTYDPCEQIRIVVNDEQGPPEAAAILRRAIAEVERATDLSFRIVGRTDDAPLSAEGIRDGDDWLPVQVSWSDAEEVPELAGDVVGLGGSTWLEEDGHRWFVTGEVVLDAPDLLELGPQVSLEVMMHELGHLVGLGHVDDFGELMHPYDAQPKWGPGDLAGLELLGQGRCR